MDDNAQILYHDIIKAFDSNGMHCDRDDGRLMLYFHFIGEFNMKFVLSVKTCAVTLVCPIPTHDGFSDKAALDIALAEANDGIRSGRFFERCKNVIYELTLANIDRLDGGAVLDLIFAAVNEVEERGVYFLSL